MRKRSAEMLLLEVLLLGLGSSAALANAPASPPFGSEVVPLHLEELEEVEGDWAAQKVVGAEGGGVCC